MNNINLYRIVITALILGYKSINSLLTIIFTRLHV